MGAQIEPAAGTRRHLRYQVKEQEAMGSTVTPPQSTSQNACSNLGAAGTSCSTTTASTVMVIVIGMSAMVLLVLIAIALLCRSHILYRRRMEQHRQVARVAAETVDVTRGGEGCITSTNEAMTGGDNFLLVLFPGEKYPVTCAHVSPLHPVAAEPSVFDTSDPPETPRSQ